MKKRFRFMLEEIFLDKANRLCVQLQLFCIAAGLIALIMTVLNCVKAEYLLALETGIGGAVSIGICLYASRTRKYLFGSVSIALIFLGLLTLFLVTGAVEGFAALWFCLYPFICLFILDMKTALAFIALGLGVLCAVFWSPLALTLPPVYTQNFLLRFPLLYIGNFAFALALNSFYSYTYNKILQLNRKFEHLSNQDGLTKLANRTYLEQYTLNLLAKGRVVLSALMLDVDYFKQYNDTYGHLAGDEVLKAIAAQISDLIPEEHAIAVRYGGEEFLILLSDCGTQEAAAFAETLLDRVAQLRIPHPAVDGYLSVSIGVSTLSISTREELLGLLKRADDGLYRAKQTGRSRVAVI